MGGDDEERERLFGGGVEDDTVTNPTRSLSEVDDRLVEFLDR
jgi:hypothetical protein